MDANKGNIFELLNGLKQYIVPIYQRLYSWDESQYGRLWDDIVEMQKENRDSHFLGSIVCIAEKTAPTGVQKYMVIDGQQRLTTLALVLIALRDSINDDLEKQKINTSFLTNQYESGEQKYKLLLTEEDKDVLISLVESKPIAEGTKSKLLNAYEFFKSQIAKNEISTDSLFEATGKLQIVIITLERGRDDPQAIFESLNSTGKALSQSDLIRNFVLMGMTKEAQESLYSKVWRPFEELFGHESQDSNMDSFFRDYLTMYNHRIPNKANVYDEFKSWRINCPFASSEELCNDIYRMGKIYTDIIFARSKDQNLAELFREVKELNMGVANPFLMAVLRDNASGLVSNSDTGEIIRLCISYVLRRSICDLATNSLNKTFATLENEIKKDDYLVSLKAFFLTREGYKEFPNDEEFEKAFVSRDIYNMRNRNYILDRLENYDNKSPVDVLSMTIEHIMPQNDRLNDDWKAMLGSDWKAAHSKYLHTIGNLTLTGYNSEMSDKPFMEKMVMKGGFRQTACRLNEYIVLQSTWNGGKIEERAKLLAAKALEIWQYPSLASEQLAPYVQDKGNEPKYSLDSYRPNLLTKMFFEKLDTRIMNLSSSVRREFKKLYVAYKLDTNFTDIVFQESRLRIAINMDFSEVNDPKGICKDVTGVGRWGNGNVEVILDNLGQLDDVMGIIKQSFEKQLND